jgi:sorting nexin-25
MLSQRHVQKEMEQDFEDFERSELWFRAIGDTDFSNKKSAPPEGPPSVNHRATGPLPTLLQPLALLPQSRSQMPSRPGSHPPLPIRRTSSGFSNHSEDSINTLNVKPATSNIEVLMSPVVQPSESSRAPLFGEPDDAMPKVDDTQRQRMEAIQAALTDIIALEQERSEKPLSSSVAGPDISSHSIEPPIHGKRRGVFDDMYDEIEMDDDKHVDGEDGELSSFQAAGPGDLHLSYEISRLGDKIAKLLSQDAMLDTLIKKAELTGDTQELKLLTKSKSAMNRELRELKFQKTQYEQQESANRLVSDRTKVAIVSSTVGDEDGKSVVRYLIEVQQLGSDGSFASGWVLARRYNEFLSMHNKLRDRYVLVRNLDFPGKRLVTALSGSFVDTRKAALEKYLQVRQHICVAIFILNFSHRA